MTDPNPFRPPEKPADASSYLLDRPASYRPASGLTLAVTIIFSIEAVFLLIAGASGFQLAQTAPEVLLGDATPQPEVMVTFVVFLVSSLIHLPVFIAAVISLCMWIHRSHGNADALGAKGTEFTPGWAVGWYFIPIVNLFKPYQAMKELYQASDPDVDPDYWQSAPTPAYLPLWWASWIGFNLASPTRSWTGATVEPTEQSIVAWATILSSLFGAAAAVLVVVLIRRIFRLQERKSRARPSAVSLQSGAAPGSTSNPLLG